MGPISIITFISVCLNVMSVIGWEYIKVNNDNKPIGFLVDE